MEDLQAIRAERDQLKRENRKLQREVGSLTTIIEREKIVSAARANLSAILSAERSKLEKYMNLLLDNCPDIIMIFDRDDQFVYCTSAFLHAAKIRSAALIYGHVYEDVFTAFADSAWIARFSDAVAQMKREKSPTSLNASVDMTCSGNPRSYTIQITPMTDEAGIVEGTLAVFHDLTDLMRAKDQAEKANHAKSDFLATVSHEIRTPMNAIIGIAEMIKKTQLTEMQKGYLASLETSSHVLLNLINDILDFSKVEAGKLELLEGYFDLNAFLLQTQSMFKVMFESKGLQFICDFQPTLPRVVYGDEKRLGQILTNILNNALKYTSKGSVTMTAYADSSTRLHFDIADTGIGIREEDIPRLYSAFEQLDLVKNKNIIGTGLGLAITKRLCNLMDGDIHVQSVYGQGSCFSISVLLPFGNESDLPSAEVTAPKFTAERARVLLVDDIAINLLVASSMLEDYAITPVEAESGISALDLVKKEKYDLIFMDHMMPQMDGVEATLAIRALGGYAATVPIIALTANAVSDAVNIFMANGFSDFLPKPIDPTALANCLYRWLPKTLIDVQDKQ